MIRERDGARALIPTLGLLTTVTAVVSSLGAPLVPSIAEDFGVRLGTAQWSLTAALLVGAISTPIVGRFATGRLRRPTILAGLWVVLFGALLSAGASASPQILDSSFALLVAGRALQGFGLALLPLALAVARDEVAHERMVRTIGLLSVTTVAGAGLGYPVSAALAGFGGLASAYLAGAACTGITLAAVWRFVPSADQEAAMRVDWAGAAALGTGMLCVLLAISEGEAWGWTATATLLLASAGALLMGGWATWTWRAPTPLVDLRLAVRPGVIAPNAVAFLAGAGMYSMLTLVVILVRADEPGFGLAEPVIIAGLILVPYSLLSVLGSRVARVVHERLGPSVLLPVGCAMFLVSSVFLAAFHQRLWHACAAMALGGIGSGFTFSSLAVLIVPHVPQTETGSAMAFNQVLRFLGFTIGSAASPALLTALGGGTSGFRRSLAVLTCVWLFTGIGAVAVSRRRLVDTTRDPGRTTAGP
jgi:MFS family permease